MHYTANGKAATDQTGIGMIFAKQPPKQRVMTLQLTNSHFSIPPGDPAYRVEARGTIPNDAVLLNFFPHLHLRGKEFEYNIVHPGNDGRYTIEPLLSVNYNALLAAVVSSRGAAGAESRHGTAGGGYLR